MKIQTTARIKALTLDGTPQNLLSDQTIDLEFSAIDTGGGFKDPILDFSFSIPKSDDNDVDQGQRSITVTLNDPGESNDQFSFSCKSELQPVAEDLLEINGRLKEEQLSKELIGFVFKLLR